MIYLLIIMGDEDKAAAVRKLTGRVAGIQVVSPPASEAELANAERRIRGHKIDMVVVDEASGTGCGQYWANFQEMVDAARMR